MAATRNEIVLCILFSAQYLHVLQDSQHYLTHLAVPVQHNSQVTDIPLTERWRLKGHHVSISLFFKLHWHWIPIKEDSHIRCLSEPLWINLYLGLKIQPRGVCYLIRHSDTIFLTLTTVILPVSCVQSYHLHIQCINFHEEYITIYKHTGIYRSS